MKLAPVFVFAIFSTVAPILPAESHSWYPKECCSNHDCVPADAIVPDKLGGRIVIVRQTRIPIPEGFTVRASPDGRIHVCFKTMAGDHYGGQEFLPLCLFLPAES